MTKRSKYAKALADPKYRQRIKAKKKVTSKPKKHNWKKEYEDGTNEDLEYNSRGESSELSQRNDR